MGQGQSAQLAQTQYSWLLRFADSAVSYASHVTLECFEHGGQKILAVAYQAASDASHEGSRSQHLRFAISKDGGETWSPPRVVAWGLGPLWNPVLFFDKESSRLLMFYSESRKSMSPGGDVKYIVSRDCGQTWAPPVTIYTHEADGEVPKVTANKPIVAADGTWYLAVHREPAEAYRTFNAKTFHPLKEAAGVSKVPAPAAAAPQGTETSACVLISSNKGESWKVGGQVSDPKTWLIDGSIEEGSKKQLLLFFRSAAGRVYSTSSTDKGASWSRPTYTSLPNPNSKFATLTIDGQVLIVYNNSATARAPLSLALSVDDGRSWESLTVIEEDPKSNYTSPSIAEWSEDTVKVAYTVWGEGIKLATIKLATVES